MKTAIALLMTITPSVLLAQPANEHPMISRLRACVQATAPAAEITGVRTAEEAIEFFNRRCDMAPLNDMTLSNSNNVAKDAGAVAPGSFRVVIREEWASFRAHAGNR